MAATALVLYYFLVYCNVCQCPFSAFRVGAPEQPRKVTDFFFSAKLFRKKIVEKAVRPESVPGRCPASFSKASAKLQTFAVTSKCFYNFFFEENQPQARNALQTHRLQPQKNCQSPTPLPQASSKPQSQQSACRQSHLKITL